MKRIIIKSILGISGTLIISASLLANAPKDMVDISINASSPKTEMTVGSAALASTRLEDFVIPDNRNGGSTLKTDRKFKIDLGEGRYILGALIFGDCGNQFVGETLGEAFGLNNLESSSGNVANFHLALSFQNIDWFSIDYSIKLTQKDGELNSSMEAPLFGWKYKIFAQKPTTEEEFYNELYNAGYDNVINDKEGTSNKYYDRVFRSVPAEDKISVGETKKIVSRANNLSDDYNLLTLQFSNYGPNLIDAYRKFEFSIDSFSFNYACD